MRVGDPTHPQQLGSLKIRKISYHRRREWFDERPKAAMGTSLIPTADARLTFRDPKTFLLKSDWFGLW